MAHLVFLDTENLGAGRRSGGRGSSLSASRSAHKARLQRLEQLRQLPAPIVYASDPHVLAVLHSDPTNNNNNNNGGAAPLMVQCPPPVLGTAVVTEERLHELIALNGAAADDGTADDDQGLELDWTAVFAPMFPVEREFPHLGASSTWDADNKEEPPREAVRGPSGPSPPLRIRTAGVIPHDDEMEGGSYVEDRSPALLPSCPTMPYAQPASPAVPALQQHSLTSLSSSPRAQAHAPPAQQQQRVDCERSPAIPVPTPREERRQGPPPPSSHSPAGAGAGAARPPLLVFESSGSGSRARTPQVLPPPPAGSGRRHRQEQQDNARSSSSNMSSTAGGGRGRAHRSPASRLFSFVRSKLSGGSSSSSSRGRPPTATTASAGATEADGFVEPAPPGTVVHAVGLTRREFVLNGLPSPEIAMMRTASPTSPSPSSPVATPSTVTASSRVVAEGGHIIFCGSAIDAVLMEPTPPDVDGFGAGRAADLSPSRSASPLRPGSPESRLSMLSRLGSTVSNGSTRLFPVVASPRSTTTSTAGSRAVANTPSRAAVEELPSPASTALAPETIEVVIREVEEKVRPSFRRREPEEVYGSASYLKEMSHTTSSGKINT